MKTFTLYITLIIMVGEMSAFDSKYLNYAQNFTAVWSNGNGKIIAGCDEGLILLSDNDGKNWRRGITPSALFIGIKEIQCAENNVCAVLKDGKIIYSEDGGESFFISTIDNIKENIMSASINQSGSGIAISDSLKIYYTKNGGKEWYYSITLNGERGIVRCLTTDNAFYISSYNGTLYYSLHSDLNNWKTIVPFAEEDNVGIPISIKWLHEKVLVSFERGCYILNPDNSVQSHTKFPFYIRDAVLSNEDSLYCCTDESVYGIHDNQIYKISTRSNSVFHENTQIAGMTWQKKGGLVFGSSMTIAFADRRGRWYYESWLPVDDFGFKTVESPEHKRIYMVGEGQYLLRSTNKGLTWIPNDTLIEETNLSVNARASIDNILIHNNVVKLYSGKERIKDIGTNTKFLDYRSPDSGNTIIRRASFLPITDISAVIVPLIKDSYLLSYGVLGRSGGPNRGVLWKTTDNGVKWDYVTKSDTALYMGLYKKNNNEIIILKTIAPLSIGGSTASTLYVAAEICHSKDNGVTFYDSITIGGLSKFDSFMKMKNDSLGYIYSRESTGIGTAGKCVLYRTSDGGFHWKKITSPIEGALDSRIISFNSFGKGDLIVCTVGTESASNLLLFSTDFGDTWNRIDVYDNLVYKQGFMIDNETMLITCVDYEQNRNKLFVVKLSELLSTNIVENEISVAPVYLWNPYPNPAGKSTTIDLQWGMTTTKEEMALDVYDITGRKLIDLKYLLPPSGKPGDRLRLMWEIDDKIPDGIYYMVLKARSFTKTRSFVILRK